MAGSSKHVLPVYLDGAKQVIANAGFDSNVADWNGLTSSVEVSNDLAANGTLRLGVPNHYGTVVFVVNKDAAQSVTISDYTSGSDSTVRVLNAEQESVTVLYNGSNWVEIAASESSAGTTGTNLTLSGTLSATGAATLSSTLGVTGAATLSSTLDVAGAAEFAGNVGFYGTTAIAQQAGAAQAAVSAHADLPADGTGASADYTQAEVTGAIETIHDLITLTNEIRQSLVDLGLIKGTS